MADVITRIVNGHPQRRLDDRLPWAYGWVMVPSEAVLKRDNPDGRPIACGNFDIGIIHCFVPPPAA